jgi:hypothetical protein
MSFAVDYTRTGRPVIQQRAYRVLADCGEILREPEFRVRLYAALNERGASGIGTAFGDVLRAKPPRGLKPKRGTAQFSAPPVFHALVQGAGGPHWLEAVAMAERVRRTGREPFQTPPDGNPKVGVEELERYVSWTQDREAAAHSTIRQDMPYEIVAKLTDLGGSAWLTAVFMRMATSLALVHGPRSFPEDQPAFYPVVQDEYFQAANNLLTASDVLRGDYQSWTPNPKPETPTPCYTSVPKAVRLVYRHNGNLAKLGGLILQEHAKWTKVGEQGGWAQWV